ncbi:histidine phosphatase family protein [Actinocatenispora rupis]|uniref:Phosphoglycerate mutase n=1 Tax=Actinocatenispora rupis TaxID=519421 RepID=A0A8J3N989_9ACTN|nr:histidine phosphatase family protein [Actinocatenispora rupis]GID11089.1 phosphoglycerate mutase [Actinocatenispora rupis]
MATLVLLRHGRTTANAEGVLAGWTPGVGLDDTGRAQAEAAATRLRALPWRTVVTSPLQRCRETVTAVLGEPADGAGPVVDDRLGECRYGDWEGRPLKELAKEPMWKVVQSHPSAAVFPGGEPLAATSARAVAAVREWDGRVGAEHGPDALWLACSHGDVIKAIVADALGMHLDQFQRIVVEPCSVTVIRYTPLRPFVMRLNDLGSDLSGLVPPPKRRRRRAKRADSDATVGGSTG